MVNNAIIILGYPGAGKSTLSELICKHTNYTHIEYDVHNAYIKDYQNIIFDGYMKDTDDIEAVIEEYRDFKITLINLDVDKSICEKNISKRNRKLGTVDISNIELDYKFEEILKKYKLDLIQIKNYKLDNNTSVCNEQPLQYNMLKNIINDFSKRGES